MKIDTTLTDNSWYNLALSLEYPNKITVHPEFNSDTYIVISSSKGLSASQKRVGLAGCSKTSRCCRG